jgi:6,7-dimethyl-8-ribityllumazine synthase
METIKTWRGELVPESARFGMVVSRYNESITSNLLSGATGALQSRGVPDQQMEVAWVPGAWEIPLAVKCLLATDRFSAVLALGAVIRGETTHDQYINQQVSTSLGQLALEHQTPVLFGILTCQTLEQAIHRSGGNVGNKGAECAEAALEMVGLLASLRA